MGVPLSDPSPIPLRVAAGVLALAALTIYVPSVGHGFVKDDFGWVAHSRITSWSEARQLLEAPTGFFRPLVSLSFAVNWLLFGTDPLYYGLTNLALMFGCAAGAFALGRALQLSQGTALLAAALWVFNWHGINMAVLWISGRTALLLVLFATFAAAAFIRGHTLSALGLVWCAMLSKEEAVLLPAVLTAWIALSRSAPSLARRLHQRWPDLAGLSIATIVYLLLRGESGAFTLSTAPVFYELSFSVKRLIVNGVQYLDRSMTFTLVVLLLFALLARPGRLKSSSDGWRVVAFGLVWWLGGFALTVFLPIRSSLYACFPSIGVALAGATIVASAWPEVVRRRPERLRTIVVAGLLLPFLMWPVYHSRNLGSVREAELSARTLAELQRQASIRGGGTVVLLRDDRSRRPSLDNAFGTTIQQAADLLVEPPIRVWIDPPPVDAGLAGLVQPERVDVVLDLRDGVLVERKS
jgi:hypothetical protein